MDAPFISVIITAYNRKEYLKEAVKSAINQSLDRSLYEIIVTKNFEDKEIDEFLDSNGVRKIYDQSKRIGEMLYNSIKASKGDVISLLDYDDLFYSNKLKKVYENFKQDTKLIYYHNGNRTINSEGKLIKHHLSTYYGFGLKKLKTLTTNSKKQKWMENPDFNNSSISVRKSVISPFLVEFETLEDECLFVLASCERGTMKIDFEPMTYYRVHSSSTNIDSNDVSFENSNIALWNKHMYFLNKLVECCNNNICNYILRCRIEETKMHQNLLNPSIGRRKRVSDTYSGVKYFPSMTTRSLRYLIFLHIISIIFPSLSLKIYKWIKSIY